MKKHLTYLLLLAAFVAFGVGSTCQAMEPQKNKNKRIEDLPNEVMVEIFLFIPNKSYKKLLFTCKSFQQSVSSIFELLTGSQDPEQIEQFLCLLGSSRLTQEHRYIFLHKWLEARAHDTQLMLPNFCSDDLVNLHSIGTKTNYELLQKKLEQLLKKTVDKPVENDEKQKNLHNLFFASCEQGNIRIALFLIKTYGNLLVIAVHNHIDYSPINSYDDPQHPLVEAAINRHFDVVLAGLKRLPKLIPAHLKKQNTFCARKQTLEVLFVQAAIGGNIDTMQVLFKNFALSPDNASIILALTFALNSCHAKIIDFLWKKTENGEKLLGGAEFSIDPHYKNFLLFAAAKTGHLAILRCAIKLIGTDTYCYQPSKCYLGEKSREIALENNRLEAAQIIHKAFNLF